MNILLLADQYKYRGWGHDYAWYWEKELFREELGRQGNVCFFGRGYDPEWEDWLQKKSLTQIFDRYKKPDFLLIHIDLGTIKNYSDVSFNDLNVPKVIILNDYFEDSFLLPSVQPFFEKYKFDLAFGYSGNVIKQFKKDNVGSFQYLLPRGVDTYIYRKLFVKKCYDVLASYTTKRKIYPLRRKIHKMLAKMDVLSYTEGAFFDEAVLKTNQSRICINAGSCYAGFVNYRVIEVLSCGSFLLSERNDDFEFHGYQDGKHLVLFDDLSDLREKIFYYLKHEDERERIANEGMRFVRENFSTRKQVSKFLSILEEHL